VIDTGTNHPFNGSHIWRLQFTIQPNVGPRRAARNPSHTGELYFTLVNGPAVYENAVSGSSFLTSYSFPASGGSFSRTAAFPCSIGNDIPSWTLTASDNWIHIVTTTGDNSHRQVSFNVDANTS